MKCTRSDCSLRGCIAPLNCIEEDPVLELHTPYKLADCGCALETGDEGRPLFVPCRLHNAAALLVEALEEAWATGHVSAKTVGAALRAAGR